MYIKENGVDVIWKVVNISKHLIMEIWVYTKALKVKISVHSNFPYWLTHQPLAVAVNAVQVFSADMYCLPKPARRLSAQVPLSHIMTRHMTTYFRLKLSLQFCSEKSGSN